MGPSVARRPSRLAAASSAVLVALVLVASIAGGALYRWCIPLARAMDPSSCCDAEPHAEPDAQPAPAARRICCETRTIDVLPSAAHGSDDPRSVDGAPASGAAVPEAWASRALRLGSSNEPTAIARDPPRARPPPRWRGRVLALLQVYRC